MLEKAAANISVIKGVLTPERAQAMSSRGRDNIDPEGGQPYSAVAMSLVFHSAHPFIPTLRADVRLFEVTPPAQPPPAPPVALLLDCRSTTLACTLVGVLLSTAQL